LRHFEKEAVMQRALANADPLAAVPNLVEIQLNSFQWFLDRGLRELFHNFSPIEDFTGNLSLELVDYHLDKEKYSVEECRDRDMTYERPIKATVRLRSAGKEVVESEVYLGDLPIMTERGTFVINGVDRVVVSQLARSPGVYFNDNIDFSGRILYSATLIPAEGAWLEMETDANDVITVRIGQTRKFPITTLMRALGAFDQSRNFGYERVEIGPALVGRTATERVVDKSTGEVLVEVKQVIDEATVEKLQAAAEAGHLSTGNTVEVMTPPIPCGTTAEVLELFADHGELIEPTREELVGKRPLSDIADPKTGRVIVKAYQKMTNEMARRVEGLHLPSVPILIPNKYIEATVDQEPNVQDIDDALADIYRTIRPGDPSTHESARGLLSSIFFDLRRYDLARVGRYKMNKKLGLNLPMDDRPELGHRAARSLTQADLISIVKYIIDFANNEHNRDDIDHLENKRVRSVGELLQNQMRLGFLRMEKVARERMTAADVDNVVPQVVLSVKPISASIKSFFGSSQLSQFMDQTNPLAELTHKRRLSALGPGGLSRQSAKLEVRDVHHSHYSRVCPIETPEGPNIGLIGSLAVCARIDEFGFLLAPYRKVVNGRVTDQIDYITADQEDQFRLAPSSTPVDEHNRIEGHVVCRFRGTFPTVPARQVDYIDVTPMQIVSPATALIPFLENDDANRALMGSNMQRQAVPLLRARAPVVKTGVERKVAVDSGAAVKASKAGRIHRVTAEAVTIKTTEGTFETHRLLNLLRSNNATCITQKPIVRKGQRVRPGDVIADGPSMQNGELALGQNVLVAFMPWGGYNYEDAILVSERLVKDDVFTSIHIDKHETEARDTKLGPEEITRDIPNVSEDALKDLDEDGVIRIGAEVRPEDILVGKVAPKGQGELTPEERLVIAIFGKKAEETRDVSLRLPHGEKGKIVDVKRFSRFKYKCSRCGQVYDFSKKPDRLLCDKYDCGGELERVAADELPAGVNMLVRVYIAQKRKLMEGDKMAGRHGNKGVISKILPEEDMPYLPDGTAVDIVLNPLGVPSRMNIGQILETHLGLVSQYLGGSFANPIFQARREADILKELDRLSAYLHGQKLYEYAARDLKLFGDAKADGHENGALASDPQLNPSGWAPAGAYTSLVQSTDLRPATDDVAPATAEELMGRIRAALEARTPEERALLGEQLGIAAPEEEEGTEWVTIQPQDGEAAGTEDEPAAEEADRPAAAPRPGVRVRTLSVPSVDALLDCIRRNVWARVGFDETTGKCRLRDGRSGDWFDLPVTVGLIYMMKLAHLVDDKIHARSTGPYSLVTQQPLGGKAQFGGQRFGEMEVWALEAYGAAYTLQEILTIKSDDVLGRVKTYESIVKGDTIMAPGIPESFRILVNELQSLGLKVSVEDERDRQIDLRDQEDELSEADADRRGRGDRGGREERSGLWALGADQEGPGGGGSDRGGSPSHAAAGLRALRSASPGSSRSGSGTGAATAHPAGDDTASALELLGSTAATPASEASADDDAEEGGAGFLRSALAERENTGEESLDGAEADETGAAEFEGNGLSGLDPDAEGEEI
jgi:DNA-directed RNA polymerase subunit beta